MCGIVAVWHKSYDETKNRLNSELKAIAHRGPDAQNIKLIEWKGGYLGLGWNRLRITGNSEKWDEIPHSNAGYLLLNGEIYNFRELIKKFDLPNYPNDAYVLLTGLEKLGLEFLNYCEGMFAGVWVDLNSQKVLAFRDFFGIKPLYYKYSDNGDSFLISSEIDIYEGSNQFDYSQLHRFRYKYYPMVSGSESKARSLLPGEVLELSTDGILSHPNLKPVKTDGNRNLIKIVNSAVLNQVPDEVPFGVLSGGGIDSSIICEVLHQAGHQEVPIFTLNDGSLHIKRLKKAADKWGYPVFEIKVPKDWKVMAEAFLEYHHIPCYDYAAWFTYLCSKKASEKGIKVLFSGAGADELLGGYRRHRFWAKQAKKLAPLKVLAGLFGGKLHEVLAAPDKDKWAWYQNLTANPSIKVSFTKVSEFENPYPDFTSKQAQWWDLKCYLPEDVLVATDRGSMLSSVEIRVPFLNSVLYNWYEKQEESYFLSGDTKHELRIFLNDSGLSFLTALPKRGFGI